jgi:hypothetical protein
MIAVAIGVDAVEIDIVDAESELYSSWLWDRRAGQRRVRVRKRGEEK